VATMFKAARLRVESKMRESPESRMLATTFPPAMVFHLRPRLRVRLDWTSWIRTLRFTWGTAWSSLGMSPSTRARSSAVPVTIRVLVRSSATTVAVGVAVASWPWAWGWGPVLAFRASCRTAARSLALALESW
jgi:hypothetical protein